MTEDDVQKAARAMIDAMGDAVYGDDSEADASGVCEVAVDGRFDIMHVVRAAIAAINTRAPSGEAGFLEVFYEIAGIIKLGARAASPREVWEREMRPKLLAAFAPDSEPDTIGSHYGNGGQFDPLAQSESGGDGATQADRILARQIIAWGKGLSATDAESFAAHAIERHRLAHSAGRGEGHG